MDCWFYILRNMETMREMPFKDRKKIFSKVELIAELAAMSMEDQQKHWEAADVLRTNINAITYHERKGREEGREETNLDHARKMKENGLDIGLIQEITGLSVEQIQEL